MLRIGAGKAIDLLKSNMKYNYKITIDNYKPTVLDFLNRFI